MGWGIGSAVKSVFSSTGVSSLLGSLGVTSSWLGNDSEDDESGESGLVSTMAEASTKEENASANGNNNRRRAAARSQVRASGGTNLSGGSGTSL